MKFPPFEVFKYEFDPLCLFISQFTGTPLNKTTSKRQMHFLSNYLNMLSTNNLTVIVETSYTDRHYLEDYSKYFSRCHQEYPKKCARVHFFDHPKLTTQYFKSLISRSLFDFDQELNRFKNSYLGNMIIRPIPDTFLGKICLQPVGSIESDPRKFLITQKSDVSLFGIKLEVESSPYQEQDRELSACATSALWALYQSHPHYLNQRPPSNSQISSELSFQISPQSSSFPNQGLKMEAMAESLNLHRLEPKILKVVSHERKKNEQPPLYSLSQTQSFYENIHNYLTSGIPVILGVEVWKKGENNSKSLGYHAITLLGMEVIDSKLNADGFTQKSHSINSLYAHDDRNGPFAKLVPIIGEDPNNHFQGFQIRVDKHLDYTLHSDPNLETYYPNAILIGSYHKVRINYTSVLETCKTLNLQMKNSISVSEIEDTDKQFYTSVLSQFVWDFKISKGSDFKESLFKSTYRNISINKILTASLPKFIWVAKVTFKGYDLFSILFDATDIPQGKVFLGYVSHLDGFEKLFDQFSKHCKEHFHRYEPEHQIEGVSDHYWGVLEYFKSKESFSEYLDDSFGVIKTPRYIKKAEKDRGEVLKQSDAVCLSDCPDDFKLLIDKKYIWLVDQFGRLMMGVESELRPGADGHPTLVQGEPARVAGELNFNTHENCWEINSKSGRYSGFEYSDKEVQKYLQNVLKQYLSNSGITDLEIKITNN